jgi:molybdate transport system substrate-binding protein
MPWRLDGCRLFTRAAALAAVVFYASGPQAAVLRAEEKITVFVAASLTNAMQEIEIRFESESGHDVVVSPAGSSSLARQIQQGAPADIFISANPGWMDKLESEGLIDASSRFDLLRNSLVLIAHGKAAAAVEIGPDLDLAGMLGTGHLAMALVDAVPAGLYGKAALENLGLWDAVAPKVAETDNVRAALVLVATGEAPYGVVYATDAVAAADVTAIGTFPPATHPPILYPTAAVRASTNPLNAAFLDFLRGPAARAAFEKQGFTVILP